MKNGEPDLLKGGQGRDAGDMSTAAIGAGIGFILILGVLFCRLMCCLPS
jgi:hypothetical protein